MSILFNSGHRCTDTRTISYWAGTDRDQHPTIPRLEGSEYLASLYEWINAAVPRMNELIIYAWRTPASPVRPTSDEIIEKDSVCRVMVSFGHRILPDNSDPIWDTTNMIRSLERALVSVGSRLGIEGSPPLVPLADDEVAWLEVHGEPKVRQLTLTGGFVDKRLPDRQPEPEVFGEFDVRSLFVGDEADPVRGFKRRYRTLGKARKRDAAHAIRACIDDWQEAKSAASGGSCWSDGEAIHAVDLLFGGQLVWEAAIADPLAAEEMWPAGADGEFLLDVVEWG